MAANRRIQVTAKLREENQGNVYAIALENQLDSTVFTNATQWSIKLYTLEK